MHGRDKTTLTRRVDVLNHDGVKALHGRSGDRVVNCLSSESPQAQQPLVPSPIRMLTVNEGAVADCTTRSLSATYQANSSSRVGSLAPLVICP